MAGETILIVEDRRENIVHLANNVLKPNGYHVLTAMDGQRGLQRILADKPDLVIMDLNMPKMDGLEVLAALRERRVDIPVILSTFYGSEQVAEQALSLGAIGYVVKPYEPVDMLRAIDSALAQHAARPPLAEAPASAAPSRMEGPMPLTRQVERWVRDMNILTRVGKALVAQLNKDRICIRTVEAAVYVTRADHAFLFLRDEDSETGLCLCAIRGPQDERANLLGRPMESRFATQVAQAGEAMAQPKSPSDVSMFEVVGSSLGPIAGAPLRWKQMTIGVIVVAREPKGLPFNEGDLEWLDGLADYASIAMRNAHTCEQLAQGSSPQSFDKQQNEALQRELDRLGQELQAAAGTVQRLSGMLDGEDDWLDE